MRYWLFLIPALFTCLLLAVNRAPAKPQDLMHRSMLLPGHVQMDRTSPPEAGIKLLEFIFQRVRNVPQLAMAKQGLRYQQQEQNAAVQQAQSKTDYRLAIRPQEQAMQPAVKRNSSVIAWGQLPPTRMGKMIAQPGDNVYGDEGVVAAKPRSVGVWERDGAKDKAGYKLKESSIASADVLTGAQSEASDLNVTAAGASPAGMSNSQGIWERAKAEANSDAAVGRLSPESRERILNSTGRLLGLTTAIDEAQSSVERKPSQQKAAEESKPKGAVLAKKSQYSIAQQVGKDNEKSRTGFQRGAGLQTINESPSSRDFREQNDDRGIAFNSPPVSSYSGGYGSSYGAIAPPVQQSSRRSETRGNLLRRQYAPGGGGANYAPGAPQSLPPTQLDSAPMPPDAASVLKQARADRKAKPSANEFLLDAEGGTHQRNSRNKKNDFDRVAEVALAPPNVVTGIPLVRLGYSEKEAAQALGTLGNAERHSTNGWTVLTFRKPGTKETALQVYMRHGSVEALRIFDATLVSPDFGVNLGDDLQKVKVKFGEPNFILSEPYSGKGQNYVYAISQVAFQLSRPARDQSPQVVSLLIFNVK